MKENKRLKHPQGHKVYRSPSGVNFAYMRTPSCVLLNIHTKNGWKGLQGAFREVPTDVSFVSESKVKVTYAGTWEPQTTEINMPPKRKKKYYGRGDNRRRGWKRSYRENRRIP